MSTAYTPPGVSIHIRNTSCSIFHKVPVQDYSHFDQYHLDIPADEAINVLLARNSFFFFSPIFSFDAQTFRSKSYNDSPFAYLLPKLDSVGAHRFAPTLPPYEILCTKPHCTGDSATRVQSRVSLLRANIYMQAMLQVVPPATCEPNDLRRRTYVAFPPHAFARQSKCYHRHPAYMSCFMLNLGGIY